MIEIKYGRLLLLFDAEDYPTISKVYGFTVSIQRSGLHRVQATRRPYRSKKICRLLLNAPQELEVDHINGNTLDNRRSNLRLVTRQQNTRNTAVHSTKKSGLPKGVSTSGKKFSAKIVHNGESIFLGTFTEVEKAEQAYKDAANKHFGEFALHNSRG